ncbi:MAG: glycosyltransferase family 2 protein [Aurantimicrobium sp.]|uniref:glycosyltransferase family 2 protein n=1 Tax=Aurantimicrobium sp. TaxID=1930784 RepID=UPI002FC64886
MSKQPSQTPKVSVITVSFNDFLGLKATRKSVEAQSYQGDIEHIVIDGGSGSEVLRWLENIHDSNFLFVSEPDSGIYNAMNKGIEAATGDLLWWVNSGDCFADKFAIQNVVKHLEDPPNQWGYGITALSNIDGSISGLSFPVPYSSEKHMLGIEYVPHPSSFVGSEIVNQIGGYDENIAIVSDQIFLARAGIICPPVLIPRVLSNFKLGGVSSTISYLESMSLIKSGLKLSGVTIPNLWTRLRVGLVPTLKFSLKKFIKRFDT